MVETDSLRSFDIVLRDGQHSPLRFARSSKYRYTIIALLDNSWFWYKKSCLPTNIRLYFWKWYLPLAFSFRNTQFPAVFPFRVKLRLVHLAFRLHHRRYPTAFFACRSRIGELFGVIFPKNCKLRLINTQISFSIHILKWVRKILMIWLYIQYLAKALLQDMERIIIAI